MHKVMCAALMDVYLRFRGQHWYWYEEFTGRSGARFDLTYLMIRLREVPRFRAKESNWEAIAA